MIAIPISWKDSDGNDRALDVTSWKELRSLVAACEQTLMDRDGPQEGPHPLYLPVDYPGRFHATRIDSGSTPGAFYVRNIYRPADS